MTLILNGTSGITDVNGTAAAPAITGTDTDTGVFFGTNTVSLSTGGTERLQVDSSGNLGLGVTPSTPYTGTIDFQIGGSTNLFYYGSASYLGNNCYLKTGTGADTYIGSGYATRYDQTATGQHRWMVAASGTAGNAITFTQAMTLDASGNLGIGTTSPSYRLDVFGGSGSIATTRIWNASSGVSDGAQILLGNSANYTNAYFRLNGGGNSSQAGAGSLNIGLTESAPIAFYTNNTERARIDSSGNLLVGKTSASETVAGFSYQPARDGAGHPRLTLSDDASTNSYVPLAVYSVGASNYRFYVGSGGTVYATNTTITAISSDQRLKQDIVDYDKGLAEVLALRPRSFAYKKEPDRKLSGFISQEVQTVLPDAIEPTLEDPEMLTYSIDWHPLLVKAIQEQQAIITQLQADVAALKGNA